MGGCLDSGEEYLDIINPISTAIRIPVINLPSTFWHTRFVQQAQWTQNLRHHLYGRVNLDKARRVLEVGCGTGAVLTELLMQSHGEIFGLDISEEYLHLAAHNLPGIPLSCGDAHGLPYPAGVFDISLCHFLLLWVVDPVLVVREMARVTQPGGAVLALAEPDYGGRIDYPEELRILGSMQQSALHQQGADPLLGRRVRSILQQAGLANVEAGILGGQWSGIPSREDRETEWKVLIDDIKKKPNIPGISEIINLQKIDQQAWERGERILFVPTFYAWGRVPLVSSG
jgi:ubiquinone/menaquinone biosynthesis C-methylase UbiE